MQAPRWTDLLAWDATQLWRLLVHACHRVQSDPAACMPCTELPFRGHNALAVACLAPGGGGQGRRRLPAGEDLERQRPRTADRRRAAHFPAGWRHNRADRLLPGRGLPRGVWRVPGDHAACQGAVDCCCPMSPAGNMTCCRIVATKSVLSLTMLPGTVVPSRHPDMQANHTRILKRKALAVRTACSAP